MKHLFFIISIFLLYACENTSIIEEQENTVNFNTSVNEAVFKAQLSLEEITTTLGFSGSKLTRVSHLRNNYENQIISFTDGTTINLLWEKLYTETLPLIEEQMPIAMDQGLYKHLAVLKICKSYIYLTLVDFYGDVPYIDEITTPTELESGEVIYQNILQLLDEAINDLDNSGQNLEIDMYYDNNFEHWKRMANTLRMKIHLNSRLIDGDAITKFNTIVNSGLFITDSSQDFYYPEDNNWEDTPHFLYDSDYNTYGSLFYSSNWLMASMLEDPRRRMYFYRQYRCHPFDVDEEGNDCDFSSPEVMSSCLLEDRPEYYPPGMVYCSLPGGYWGRDHTNDYGTPPDGLRRTIVGVYPAGGKFDDNDFDYPGGEGTGGQGKGITPIMLASYVDFMRAEVALESGDYSQASSFLQAGIQKSINKVLTFISLDPDTDTSYIPTGNEITTFINGIITTFNDADIENKWEILATQQFITQYGNGIESYNFYRRNGFPHFLQFPLTEDTVFIRSFPYPSIALEMYSFMSQKPNGQVQVFWDNNQAYPIFPIAN